MRLLAVAFAITTLLTIAVVVGLSAAVQVKLKDTKARRALGGGGEGEHQEGNQGMLSCVFLGGGGGRAR